MWIGNDIISYSRSPKEQPNESEVPGLDIDQKHNQEQQKEDSECQYAKLELTIY